MAEFVRLWEQRGCVVDELLQKLADAETARADEIDAVTHIQRCFRGARARAAITNMSRACVEVERVFRGHQGRAVAAEAKRKQELLEEESVFHYYASVIQRVFKGYYSRRYKHDFFARKAYIESIKTKSEELRQQLDGHMDKQIERNQEVAEEKAREEFKKVTQNLHHLLSTQSTPGVYNPPYAMDQVPTVFGVPVEEHLKRGVKDFIKTNGLHRVKPAPYAAPSRLSVQASSEYGVVERTTRDERRYRKMRHLSAQPFVAGGKPRAPLPEPGIASGTQFQEAWRAAQSMREKEHSTVMKAARVSHKPFHVSVTRGRLFEEYERSAAAQGRGPGGDADAAGAGATGGAGAGAGALSSRSATGGGSRRSKKKKKGFVDSMRSLTLASEHTNI